MPESALIRASDSPLPVEGMQHTIALVDDDRNIQTSVSIALEAEGYKVRTYGDGAEALRALTASPVDLAILDIKMPRMDGMELLRHLRQKSNLPIIFLTSKDYEVDEVLGALAAQEGANTLDQKALREGLLDVVRTIDSHIKRLRKKFKEVDDDFAQIETLYGVGYRYRDS